MPDIGIIVTAIDHATAPLRNIQKSVENLGEAQKTNAFHAKAMENGLKAIEVVIGGILLEKAEELTKKFLELASASQNADIRLAAWTGGSEKADAILQKLNNSVGASGIKIESLGNSFIKLKAAGLGDDQATRSIISLSNAIAAVGGGDLSAKLDAAATAFQRFSAKGVVSVRELNAILGSTGLSVKELAAAGGVGITQFYNQLRDRLVGAQTLLDDFNRAAEKKFGAYAKLLENTLGGSLSKMKNDLSLAFSSLVEQPGGANDRIVAIVQNLDKALTDLIKNQGPAIVEKFFQFLSDIAPAVARTGELLFLVGKALLAFIDIASSFLSSLPPEVTEFGIVGLIVGGRKTAAIAAVIGIAISGISKMDLAASEFFNHIGLMSDEALARVKKNVERGFISTITDQIGAGSGNGDRNNWISKFFGTPEQLDKIHQGVLKLMHTAIPSMGVTDTPENTALDNKLRDLRLANSKLMADTQGKIDLMDFKAEGNDLMIAVQGINNETDKWVEALTTADNKMKDEVDLGHIKLKEYKDFDAAVTALTTKIHAAADRENAQQLTLNMLKRQQLEIETKIFEQQLAEQSRQMAGQMSQNVNPLQALYAGTSGGQIQEAAIQKRAQLTAQIYGYESQINALRTDEESHRQNFDQDEKKIMDLQQMKNLTQQYSDTITAAGMAQTKFLNELGSAIEGDLASGISGLIQGTMTWGDVGRKVFGDLIDMSIKYLIQLAEMELFGKAATAASIALAVPTAAALTAIWGPAAMAASIATLGTADATGAAAYEAAMATAIIPHADGGVPGIDTMTNNIMTGPTLFGLGGEAGTEGVLPLTRIGGKLGVHATGTGGGDTYNINIHAIDTQSGLDFLGKHISHIDAGIQQRKRVNLK